MISHVKKKKCGLFLDDINLVDFLGGGEGVHIAIFFFSKRVSDSSISHEMIIVQYSLFYLSILVCVCGCVCRGVGGILFL